MAGRAGMNGTAMAPVAYDIPPSEAEQLRDLLAGMEAGERCRIVGLLRELRDRKKEPPPVTIKVCSVGIPYTAR